MWPNTEPHEPARYPMFVGGEWVAGHAAARLPVADPYAGSTWAEVPEGDAEDVDLAVGAARRAFEESDWSRRPRERARLLHKLADLIESDAERLAAIESRDNGKTIREELAMFRGAPAWFRQAASQAETVTGDVPAGPNPDVVSMTLREPYGVVGIQLPWNTPGVLLACSGAPALAAGNTIVVKPSEIAPCSTIELARLAERAGFPPGVINVVTGFGPVVGAALCAHPGVDKLVFTGSPEGGRIVAAQAARRLAPTLMELGGKSANIVFEDADLDAAARGLVGGFTASAGQSCVCGSRALIQRSVFDVVTGLAVEHARALRVGDPSDPDTDIGPVCTDAQLARIEQMVDSARQDGAKVLLGGGRAPGLFYEPTILSDVDNSMPVCREEIFGPVMACLPFDQEADAIRIANDSRFGLAAGIWTHDLGRAHRVARAVHAGTVWVNQYRVVDPVFPFGGYGESGYGRVNGRDGYLEMTRAKSIQMLVTEPASPSTAGEAKAS
jgi:acyl-CoA reductase-like NAD-dependent aldehyde dehydrogenase